MASVVMRPPEDFSIARGLSTIGGEWSGVSGAGASVVACPSGFGWALAKDTSQTNNHAATRVIAAPTSGTGFAAFLTLDMPAGDTAWRLIHRTFVNGTNRALWLTYQPSTNQFRLEYNNSTVNVAVAGSTVAGPTDPTSAFHIAVEVTSDASSGTAKIWLNGTLVLNLSGVNTGNSGDLFDRETVAAPASTGAGQTTIGNVCLWNPAAHSWDGQVKIPQRLAPIADVSSSSWSGAAPYWEKLDDPAQNTATTTGGTIRVELADIGVEPKEVYGLWVYWRQSGSGSANSVLHEPSAAYDHIGAASGAFAFMREYIAGPNGGGDWDEAALDELELTFSRVSGSVTIPYAHLLVLRTVEEAGPPTGNLSVTLDDVTLVSEGQVPTAGNLSVTLADATLESVTQVGIGSTGTLAATLADVTLESAVEIDVSGSLAVTLGAVSLTAFGVSGSLGPFTRRPIIVTN
jgi:hypothetical protein